MTTYAQPVDSPPLRDDLFPAQVYLPAPGTTLTAPPHPTAANYVPEGATLLYRPARVLFSATHLWIFKDSENGPALDIYGAMEDLQGDRKHGFRVIIAPSELNPSPAYTQLIITRYANCGCGSRLRSFRPFAQMRLLPDSQAPRVSHR